MSTPNWTKLVLAGRAKAPGVPWSVGELKAVLEIAKAKNFDSLRPAADFVRRGALTVEDVDRLVVADSKHEKEHGSKPVEAMSHGELVALVKDSQPHITKETPTEVLRKVVEDDSKKDVKKGGKKK